MIIADIADNGNPGLLQGSLQELRVRSPEGEDPLKEEMAIHSNIFAWEILWTEEPSRLQSMGLERVGYD